MGVFNSPLIPEVEEIKSLVLKRNTGYQKMFDGARNVFPWAEETETILIR